VIRVLFLQELADEFAVGGHIVIINMI
jgi:hypothetical protein